MDTHCDVEESPLEVSIEPLAHNLDANRSPFFPSRMLHIHLQTITTYEMQDCEKSVRYAD